MQKTNLPREIISEFRSAFYKVKEVIVKIKNNEVLFHWGVKFERERERELMAIKK